MSKRKTKKKFYKYVLIVGKGNDGVNIDLHPIFSKDGIVIGNGEDHITIEEDVVPKLKGKIDSRTKIFVCVHGGFVKENYKLLLDDNDCVYPEELFMGLEECYKGPLEIHLHACYSGAAVTKEDMQHLPDGSVVVAYTLQELFSYTDEIVRSIQKSVQVSREFPEASLPERMVKNLPEVSESPFVIGSYVRDRGEEAFVKRTFRTPEHMIATPEALHSYCTEILYPGLQEFHEKLSIGAATPITGSAFPGFALDKADDRFVVSLICHAHNWINHYPEKMLQEIDAVSARDLEKLFSAESKYLESGEVDSSLLESAVKRGHLEILKVLLSKGAKALPSDYHATLLHIAGKAGQVNMVDTILNINGISVDDRDLEGSTALFYAARDNKSDFIHKLLSVGADINAVDEDCNTALHYAAFMGNIEVVEVLLENGIDVHMKNESGKTVLDLISNRRDTTHNREACIDLIEKKMKQVEKERKSEKMTFADKEKRRKQNKKHKGSGSRGRG